MGVEDSLAAWMLDSAVLWFGTTIENALNERVKVVFGKETSYKPRYTLARLLNPNFRLPKPLPSVEDDPNPWAVFMAMAGKKRSGIKRWKYIS